MNPNEIAAQLRNHADSLASCDIESKVTAQTRDLLREAAGLIEELAGKASLGEALLKLFRDELLNRARATAKLSGRSSKLLERMIGSEDLSLDDLLALKRDVDLAFDTAFTNSLRETASIPTEDQDKLAQFKVG